MTHPSLRQAPLLLAVLAAFSSAACSSPPPRDTDADAEKQVVRLGNSFVNILSFCQRNPVTCCRHFPSFCEATQKQDAEDYRRLWKNPRAFCESYMSRHSVSLDIIWPQEIQLYGLAACAENGWGVPYQDRERLLFRWLSISANNEDLDARKRLIDIYLNGWEGQKPDAAEAIKWMEPLAQDGSLSKDELYRLAELLETDRKGLTNDVVRLWQTRAAEAGHRDDPSRLAASPETQTKGTGSPRGNRDAQYRSGMRELAKGHVSDALRFLTEAAAQGHEEAAIEQACLQWARTWGELEELRKSAGKPAVPRPQNAASFIDLPLWEWSSEEVGKKMQRDALNLFQHAAEAGQAGAHFVLGQIYASESREEIFERSPEKALDYLTKAAGMGLNDAKLRLASHLLKGDLGTKDIPRALELLEPLAKQENLDAMVTLGGLLLHFEGTDPTVPADPVRGVSLLEQAANQGHRDSMERLAKIYEEGWPGISPIQSKALHWHKQAASHGSFHSALRLGRAYDKGELGESPSPEESVRWYGLALNACSDSKTKAACDLEQRGEIVSRLGAAWRRSKSGSANGSRWQEAYSYLTLACDMMRSGDACRELAEMLARGEIMPLRDERTRTVRWAAGRAKSVEGRVVSRCIQEHGVLDPGSGPYPRQITPTPEAKRCIEEKTKGTAGGLYAVGAILLGLPGPWDEILPESDDTSLLTANFPIEDSAKAEWAKRVTANRRLMTAEDKRELMRLRGMARNDEEKAIALEMLNLASEKGVWEASQALADFYAKETNVPGSAQKAASFRALAKKQKKSSGK